MSGDKSDAPALGRGLVPVLVMKHVLIVTMLGVGVYAWLNLRRRLRSLPAVRKDLEHVKHAARTRFAHTPSPYEGEKIVWRGDRIEWLFHNGFIDWWVNEWRAGRAIVPSSL